MKTHIEYFQSGKVQVRVSSQQEHLALVNLMKSDEIQTANLTPFNTDYPYYLGVDTPGGVYGENKVICSYLAPTGKEKFKKSFESLTDFLASPLPTFGLVLFDVERGDIMVPVVATEKGVVLNFVNYESPRKQYTLTLDTLEKFVALQKEFNEFHG